MSRRNYNPGKTAGALKHASGKMKANYMNQYVELRKTIRESNDQPKTCPQCGEVIGSRPMFMIGKYDICFPCYEANQQVKTVISGGEILEISTVHNPNQQVPF